MRLNFLLAGFSALLLILAFPGFDIAVLAPFALAPLLVAIARASGMRERFLLGYAAGILYWSAVCNWIQFVLAVHANMAQALAWLGFVLFSLFKALQFGAFSLLAGWLMPRRWAVVTVPALWVAIEWTHTELGFAWLALGNAGIDMSVPVRLAPFTGVYGISFAFAMMSTALAFVVLRRPRIELAPLALLLVLPLLPRLPDPQRGSERAVLVQPNVSETATWTPQWTEAMHQRLAALTTGAAAQSERPPRLVVWPEAPLPLYYAQDEHFRELVNHIAVTNNVYLILNVTGSTPSGAPLNSALLVSPQGQPLGDYSKMNLVPFGEFVPRPFHALVAKVSTEAGDFAPGTRQTPLRAGAQSIGVFICYESVFPDFVRRFANQGAGLLVNISNDGWYGRTAARDQHLRIVRMRAAENRRWILRATNDGITATIDPAGRVYRNLPSYVEGAVGAQYSYGVDTTFYARYGDWFVWLSMLVAGCGLGVSVVRRHCAS